jgi:hypothetical protein
MILAKAVSKVKNGTRRSKRTLQRFAEAFIRKNFFISHVSKASYTRFLDSTYAIKRHLYIYTHVQSLSSQPSRCRISLDYPVQLTCRPSTIKVARLWLYLLPVNKAIPRPRVKAHITLQILESLRWTLIRPYPISNYLFLSIFIIACNGVVRCPPFPFTECRFLGLS